MGLCCAALLTTPDPARPDAPTPRVRLWGHDADEIGRLAQTRQSPRLPGLSLADSVRVCLSDADALDGADLIVSAIPVQFMRSAWARLRGLVPAAAGVLSVAKGVETTTLLRPTQIVADVLADDPDRAARPLACLSGPTIATELARGMPATMVCASDDAGFAERVQHLFSRSWLRVYTNADLLGVELAGATKNVIAIAAGILDGLGVGYNAKSALLARGLAEIARLGAAMGASPQTFFGIAGVGDLATTCFSPEGRNRTCGEALGRGQSLAEHLAASPFVVEGVETSRAVLVLAEKYRVEMPIVQGVHAVLFEGLDPVEGITKLMSRELRDERVG
jgi:glycerol-3-phosphate dehydrogenase (NAD(P)+)